MSPRTILTLHPPLGDQTLDGLLTAIEPVLQAQGATRIWVETRSYPDLTVMALMPDLEGQQPLEHRPVA